jgi:hypothetical protein
MGQPDIEANALNGLGEAYRAAGRPGTSLRRHTRALAVATAIGDADEQSRAWRGMARGPR